MSVLDGSFQVQKISEEVAKEQEIIREAETQGHSFVKLSLQKNIAKDMDYKLKYVKGLKHFVTTVGLSAQQIIEFVPHDVELVFRYDIMLRHHIAYMLDDNEKGNFSEKGYNRDFLASHHGTGDIKILDEKVEADIMVRVKTLEGMEKEKEPFQEEKPIDSVAMGKEDLDKEIKFLMEQRKKLEETVPEPAPEQEPEIPAEVPPEAPPETPKPKAKKPIKRKARPKLATVQ